jgi:UDP-N-acetylmuramoyl-L-alanyl-D-glutamate--2,6-diaminopimelate ligase
MQPIKKFIKGLLPKKIRRPVLNIYHLLVAVAANIRYGFPSKKLKVIMVTGTNGKTTVATLIAGILEDAGRTVGINSTAYYRIAGKTTPKKSSRTLEDIFILHGLLAKMKQAGCEYVILEATSQGLDQNRLWGVPCTVAVMTNLTQDHLDYHGTMERYAAAKAKLFKRKPNFIVLNRDDEWFDFFNKYDAKERKLSYGEHKEADAQIVNANLRKDGSDFTLRIDDQKLRLHTKLPGRFNAYNAAAAALAGYLEGLSPEQVAHGLATVSAVPGRLERVEAGQSFEVIVDYAHTPDALENVLSTLRQLTKGKLTLVFGATGDRDRAKRPLMGEIAAEYADRIFVTDEETYSEDGANIRAAILEGVPEDARTKTTEIADRGEAILAAFKAAKPGDTVVLTGLGHELTRNMGGQAIAWNDTEAAKELLQKL